MHQQARGKPVTAGAATTPITTPSSVRRMPPAHHQRKDVRGPARAPLPD